MGIPRILILASASSARRELLRSAGLACEIRPSGVDESLVWQPDVRTHVQELAKLKAEAVAADTSAGVVIGCDSMLAIDDHRFGKPGTAEEALRTWAALAGRQGTLYTGHTILVINEGDLVGSASGVDSTEITFGRPTAEELLAYAATGEPLSAAGAFSIGGFGAPFVAGISGSPSNVLGLSLPLLYDLLRELGMSITQFWH